MLEKYYNVDLYEASPNSYASVHYFLDYLKRNSHL